jgi:CRISPR-associated protein Cmr1
LMRTTVLTYQVSFNTPAFLGNAEQQAQWRTPPFKAMLRQWWRVVKAPDVGYDHLRLLTLENALFGSAGDDDGGGRSQVQLRLSGWDVGTLARVPSGEMVSHNEVPSKQVGANLYLGYGPIGGQTRNAIDVKAPAQLFKIRCPAEHAETLQKAMQLAAWFGTLGSRSRNGWGSIEIACAGGTPLLGFGALGANDSIQSIVPSLSLTNCLNQEWRHAVGTNNEGVPAIWRLFKLGPRNEKGQTTLVNFASWEETMRELARIKIAVRTAPYFKFQNGGNQGHPSPLPRHVLSYPAGSKHSVSANNWGQSGRMANQVLFKVHRRETGFVATIAHFPTRIPLHMTGRFQLPDQIAVWQEVHRLLDAERTNGLQRMKGTAA